MIEPVVVKGQDALTHGEHGEGRIKKLLYPENAGTKQIFIGLAEVPPGEAPHVFHKHGREKIGDHWLEYDPAFEEFYFIVSGAGSMQWKSERGEITETPVEEGDSIYMPPGVVEHRVFNTCDAVLRVLYGGSPPAVISIA